MHATLYKPISENAPTWAETKITDIFKIISYNYTKKFYEVGSFTMVIPVNEPSAELLETNTFLATSDGDYLFVTDIKETESRITLEGHDLKCLLAGRITLFPTEEQDKGTYGYYVTQGSTGECICDIVNHNIAEASDPDRRIFGFAVSYSPFGLQNDTYMTRLEPLDSVVGTLCKNAGIGYDVTMERGSALGDSIKFSVIQPTDRSADQTDVPRVIFSQEFLNVENLSRETGVDSEKNAIYAINGSNIDDAVVKLVNRDGEGKADYGVYRRETTVNVNCDIDEIDSYALKEAEDFITTDSFVMDVMAAESYKKDWFVGDIVTFRHKGVSRNVPIVAAEIQRTADKFTVKISAGETMTKPVSLVNRTANKAVNEITQKKFDDGYVTVVKELPDEGKKNKIYLLAEETSALTDDLGATRSESGAETINGFVFIGGEWKKFGGEGGGEASGGVGQFTNEAKNSEIFNSYKDVTNENGTVTAKKNYINPKTAFAHASGAENSIDEEIESNFSNMSAILAGYKNKIIASAFAAIVGGQLNKVSSQFAAIVGGMNNEIKSNSNFSCIAGGSGNNCEGHMSLVGAGMSNSILNAWFSAICGGERNIISAAGLTHCFIGGGAGNKITGGSESAIVGGSGNTVSVSGSAILSGMNNSATGYYSAIISGNGNKVTGSYSAILAGGGNAVNSGNSAVIAGSGNKVGSFGSVAMGDNNEISGGNGCYSFVCGEGNKLNNAYYCIVCGKYGTANEMHAFVIGNGFENAPKNIFYVDRLGNCYAKSFNIIGETTASEASAFSARSADTPDLSELTEQLTQIKADIEALKAENQALKAEILALK